jgi:hypothetical protein
VTKGSGLKKFRYFVSAGRSEERFNPPWEISHSGHLGVLAGCEATKMDRHQQSDQKHHKPDSLESTHGSNVIMTVASWR